ncbi:hypothetical protein CPLU01_00327 [Colletotrichum plurivorum]|uniref:Nephrocystin 3-like N-terminal domain-containing protein n=1 Tax=Colletotrichum plurivorum TaxID=2175906 RepID=A0A8H6NSF4_9PEZI|nr:hypothetical protein CPLU01_00327 [Colletotrichum plurivorum]
MHSALTETHELGALIWEPLWSEIFESHEFESWQLEESKWMFRCVGPPGSGKTTLAALITERLKQKFSVNKQAVASIFIRKDVTSSDTAFVEEALTSAFRQLFTTAADEATITNYRLHLDARRDGRPSNVRIQLLRNAFSSLLSGLDRAFLVVDALDRCDPAVSTVLENELSRLASSTKLKVFLTSRISCLETVPEVVSCNSCADGEHNHLSVYWVCASCEDDPSVERRIVHVQCQYCRDRKAVCKRCGNATNFVQPFNQVQLYLDNNGLSLDRFISRDLEIEHGDLGLKSSEEDKPPPSELGRSLRDPRNRQTLDMLRERIAEQAHGNVSLALLRLSNVHRLQSVDGVLEPLADVLPSNVVAFFHDGVRRIVGQPAAQRDLGLKVIAAVAHYDFYSGIAYEALDVLIRLPEKTLSRHQQAGKQPVPAVLTATGTTEEAAAITSPKPYHRLEDMLHAARGFLVVGTLPTRPLRVYCDTFRQYVRQKYSKPLADAYDQLDFERVKVGRDGGMLVRRGLLFHTPGLSISHTF